MDLSLQDFLSLTEAERVPYIKDHAILYAQQFDRESLDYHCRLADTCRKMHKTSEGAYQADFCGIKATESPQAPQPDHPPCSPHLTLQQSQSLQ